MCGIVGIYSNSPVNQQLYDAMLALQHRGQDAAGMITCDKNNILSLHKDNGLVKDVFRTRDMRRLVGNIGLAHIRYPTAGSSSQAEAQPFYVNSPYGVALAHNGNLVNSQELQQEIFQTDRRHINTQSDSEVLLNILAHELHTVHTDHLTTLDKNNIFSALDNLYNRCLGGYAAVALIVGHGIIGFRDPHGIRPLVYGRKVTPEGIDYILASESAAIDLLGFQLIADVAPGEVIYINNKGELFKHQSKAAKQSTPCIFEYVYLSRPDSIIENVSVYKARLHMGKKLAAKINRVFPHHDIDVVMPIPDTSRTAAITLAYHLGAKYREGLIKNHYIGRTFIMPGQQLRKKSVRQKLNAVYDEFKDKNVLLVDDSIVRGTTSKEIIQMARDAGANKVYFASAAPPVRYPNVYGIDMPSQDELIASNKTEEEIAIYLNADKLFYQDIEDLKAAISSKNPALVNFESSVFDGKYITGNINCEYLHRLHTNRNDIAKVKKQLSKNIRSTSIESQNLL
ncbi:MAG: amidophosphoribosyltransferase [Gammaproteobacteria bacterium]|nr:amidophosphoribosyltransferase [Gammaproteobacteria bacterium]